MPIAYEDFVSEAARRAGGVSAPRDTDAGYANFLNQAARRAGIPDIGTPPQGGTSEQHVGGARVAQTTLPAQSTTTTATTPAADWKTAAAEMAGGTVGMLGGNIGSGAGTAIGGAAADLVQGRPFSPGEAALRFGTGAVVPAAVEGAAGLVGKGLGAGTRALAAKFPSFAEFAEGIAPGVMRRSERAVAATGDLGDLPPQVVKDRFSQWAKAMFDHVRDLTGTEAKVPTTGVRAEMERLGITSVPGLSKTEKAALEAVQGAEHVDFETMRTVESALNRLARARRGTTIANDWRGVARAAASDVDEFMASPDVGPEASDALKSAKQQYRESKQAMKATTLYRKSVTPGGQFNPKAFAKAVKTWDDAESLDWLTGQHADELRALSAEFGAQTDRTNVKLLRHLGTATRLGIPAGLGAGAAYGAAEGHPGGALETLLPALALLTPQGRGLSTAAAGQSLAEVVRQYAGQLSPADVLQYLQNPPQPTP